MRPRQVDASWLKAHPLPGHEAGTDKDGRGRVLVAGGSELVPGALLLTGEAVLRAGAGRVRLATVRSVATMLGSRFPEAGIIGLAADSSGHLGRDAAEKLCEAIAGCDTFVLGPGMHPTRETRDLVERVLEGARNDLPILLDAAAISCAGELAGLISAHKGGFVLTPHHGEMARLAGIAEERVAGSPTSVARDVARTFNCIVVLKSHETVIAAPDGALLTYGSDCVGLATGGSGDVLAGVIAGLMARGAPPLVAAAWGVRLHGEAGRAASARIGPIGFLARDLLEHIPRLMTV